ncbi:hypothetical protein QTP70_003668 [Hemibagrus guttatus]|uniref:ribonuclease H n=1 Tax=Hemibagrus guttatus TaxID=175788 RepID=A0AAE0V9S0_9TELE|nr:hypothetical protein QTP70_003668 [Hemibagrus guttatus]
MERRKVDILCVQETRWKGSKARSIGAGFKLFYYGVDSKRNGVGVVLKEEFVRNVLEVKRVSDRVMSLKLEIEGLMLNVVSGYAPQVGCELEEKERFWSELDEVMESIPTGERVVIGADFNGHVGEGNTGDEEVMGKFGVKEKNLEGQMVVDFAKRMDMGVVNTYFQKREEHRVTYKSGGRSTQVDYILCRRGNLKEISDCKVVVGESVARQHRMVVCRMTLMVCKKKRSEIEKKTKWWKLKKEECCEEFRQKLRQALGGQVVLPDDWETTAEVIRETGRKVLGVSSGRRKEDKETWWWNEEVQDSIQRKRLAKKKWDMDRTEENRQEYKELQRRVKREVSKAKQKAYDEVYTRLDTREGEKDLYRLARQRDRDGKDVQQVRVIKDRDGRVLSSEESVQRRWKEYFEELMNEENEREKRVEGVNSVEQKVDKIRKEEVRKALKRMKSGKAVGPDDIPVEVWKCLGEAAVEFLASLFNRVLESERMPEEWRRSVLVPIFKNKGDVQSCSNYRGIKLMSHTMKVWERVVEARLRKVVEICEQQYGFMPRKSTTDAIFALRILMEKYRDGQRELHCVFVDLEKAYDRVPREEPWYCMRKSGVAEKYVRVVQDMYERSRTVVRCAVGQTEEFNVEVGLHQGSALSPFLFAIVMDQLSEEVRQESPWTMMFADDIVICSESREQVEENLERWRFALERRGMKVSRSKTEYMCVNEREGSGTVRLQGEEVKKVQEFKYLGSTVQSNGECEKEVKKRVQAGWNGWRKVSGVLCDRKISARIKGKVYRTVVRPAMLYGLETVSLRKRQESELEVAELKMLRFSLGVTRLDRIRNEYIRGTAHVGRLGDKVREARLRWFGHVQRRESEYVEKPKPELTSSLKGAVLTGNSVTLYCTLKPQSAGWKFYWSKPTQSSETETESYSYTMRSVSVSDGESPKPTVTINPDTQVFIGETVTFRCDVQKGRDTEWTYNWFRDNAAFYSSVTTQISIRYVTDSHRGKYTCRGRTSDYQMSEMSDPVTLSVSEKPKPELTSNLKGAVLTGNSVTLYCTLKPQSAGWKFYWSKPTQSSETETESDSYTISSVSVSDGESPKPMVIVKPDKQVFSGETVTFRCGIQSTKDIEWTYIWNKKDYIKTQEFSISSVTVSDRGTYTCRGMSSDSQFSKDSDPVTLTVSEKPRPTVRVTPQSSVYAGDSVTLSCNLMSTGWTFLWYEDPKSNPLSPTASDTNTHTVTVSKEGGVKYYCKARRGDYDSEISDPATITVTENPKLELTSDLKGAAVTGTSVTLSCTLKPHSAGWKFYWIKPTQSSETETETHHYFISSVRVSDGGQYKCRARRGNTVYYTDYSDALWVNVTDGDVILDSPVHPVTEGRPLILRCLSRSKKIPDSGVDFYKDDSILQNQTTGEMTISSVSKSDEGFYHCKHPERGESPKSWVSVRVLSYGKAATSVLKLLSSVVTASVYVLVTIILAVKCYRARDFLNVTEVCVCPDTF